VLLAAAGTPVTAQGNALEIPDDPCWVLLSSTGLLARTENAEPLPSSGPRASHDVITAVARCTARGEYGILTSAGRVIRSQVIDLPSVPTTASAPNLQGGSLAAELIDLAAGERAIGLTTLGDDTYGWALGTLGGVVKRTNPEQLGKDSWDLIRLEDGDEVVGAIELSHDLDELVFISSDAQLLHFPASAVRPQGRSGGGMAGIKLAAGAKVVFFGVCSVNDSVVVTNAGASQALPGTDSGTLKVTPFDCYPGKGRATGGVRCQRFLKGEDSLLLAWAGPSPAIAAAASGSPVELPEPDPRRDASGSPSHQPIAAVASRYHG
jgi:DNA gyrase subunit A